ncbi:hypothetical protein [Nakamurella deserti]|uniref:hypothetical protein n=1 Tax=Nakamurella deserti TaxID=2164074 RepID=UPI000DBE09A7|nr:hypothetical protein [Nakamurella deserti]
MTLFWIAVIAVIVLGGVYLARSRSSDSRNTLADAAAEARRWVERLGGQVYSLDAGGNAAAKQAIADASERFTAAGSQVEQATTVQQYRLAQQTAYEGLYYIAAARTTLGLDPGPELPPIPGQAQAGAVTEQRRVEVEGREYEASPEATSTARNFYPGGMVAGRPVPRGWYSEPWWKPALVAGAWGVGAFMLTSALFGGMAGNAYADGYADGASDGGDGGAGDGGGDAGDGSGYDGAADTGGDYGDTGGGDYGGDFGGGDFGGGDFGGDFGGGMDF